MFIDEQTLKDLEFDVVREFLARECKSKKAKINALKIRPFLKLSDVKREFEVLQEIQDVYLNDAITFPHASSEDIDNALNVLRIENGVLTLDELVRVFHLCLGTDNLVRFAKKNQFDFPNVWEACSHIDRIHEIIKLIKSIA